MNKKNGVAKKITTIILAFTLIFSGVFIPQSTVRAAGWLDYVKELSLGSTVVDTIKSGDYKGNSDEIGYSVYWHVYKFTMPQSGLLNVYIESAAGGSKGYFGNDGNYSSEYTYAIYPASNPDKSIWVSGISDEYSAARAMYYGGIEIPLDSGEYYFTIRESITIDLPYYLTLSYKESNINVTSISLNQKNLKLEPGEQAILSVDILPDNATDKTITWESSDSSIASVENGTVTAQFPGTATITASSSDGEVSASCAVTVIDTISIDTLEESRPTITSLQSRKKKFIVYYEPINMDNVKYQVSYKIKYGKWKIKNVADSPSTIRSLKSKKNYSVRVRGYKNIDGNVYYSSWSQAKRVKTK